MFLVSSGWLHLPDFLCPFLCVYECCAVLCFLFCFEILLNFDPPALASQVAGTAGMQHHTLVFFKFKFLVLKVSAGLGKVGSLLVHTLGKA